MAITHLVSQDTITAQTEINGADVLYYSANISENGNFNFSVTGQVPDTLFGTDKKLSAEARSDIEKFIEEVYLRAEQKRENVTIENVAGIIPEEILER
ncbi:MAG: hypothetical protein LBS41_04580 [Streptococcaceae bacterium]|jgi:hypothetical protein|nr:hypothetical protein [Streptococcaceae bacterium]